jgi:hypothetical protein
MFAPTSNSNEYGVHAPNQQFNQLVGKLPNWQGRLGAGTTGGGVNLGQPQPQQGAAFGGNPNVAMMIRALMGNK